MKYQLLSSRRTKQTSSCIKCFSIVSNFPQLPSDWQSTMKYVRHDLGNVQPAIAILAYPGKSVIFIYTKGRSIKTKETGSQCASKGGSVMDRLANVRNDLGRWLESNCRALAVSLSSRGIDRIRRRCCDGSCTCP